MDVLSAQWNTRLEYLRDADRRLGRFFGSPAVDAAIDFSLIDYGFSLAWRVLLVGSSSALLFIMVVIASAAVGPNYKLLIGFTYGLCLLAITHLLYPDRTYILMPFLLMIGMASIVGSAAAVSGIDAKVTIQVLPQMLPIPFGILISLEFMRFLVWSIVQAFQETEEAKAKRLARRLAHPPLRALMNDAERREYRRLNLPLMIGSVIWIFSPFSFLVALIQRINAIWPIVIMGAALLVLLVSAIYSGHSVKPLVHRVRERVAAEAELGKVSSDA